MKKIYNIICVCCLIVFCLATQTLKVQAQNCTTALQPIGVVVNDVGPSGVPPTAPGVLSETGAISVQWDPQCGVRAGDGQGC